MTDRQTERQMHTQTGPIDPDMAVPLVTSAGQRNSHIGVKGQNLEHPTSTADAGGKKGTAREGCQHSGIFITCMSLFFMSIFGMYQTWTHV